MRWPLRLLVVSALLGGCERAGFAAANLPAQFGHATAARDIAYGREPWQKLDIYKPKASSKDNTARDVVVFLYGGRWTKGARADYRFVANAFAQKGFITVIPDYAKYPQVRFPAFVEDAAKALAWVHDNIAGHSGNHRRIHVVGHSAGAHIGALLAADKSYLAAEKKTPSQVIASFAGLAGPYAFTPDEPDLIDMFGPPARFPAMQVPTFIDGREPPMLLLWGAEDVTVKRFNLDKLQASIEAKRGRVRSFVYPGGNHINIAAALSWINPGGLPVLDDITQFFSASGAGR